MKQGEEDFEFVKDNEDDKGNYILQKDKKTKGTFIFVVSVLVILVLAVIFIPKLMN